MGERLATLKDKAGELAKLGAEELGELLIETLSKLRNHCSSRVHPSSFFLKVRDKLEILLGRLMMVQRF